MISVKSARSLVANQALPYLCKYLGVNAAFRAAQQDRLLILCYHSVVSDENYTSIHSDYAISVKAFREQMGTLARQHQPIAVSDLAAWWAGKSALPRHAILITFDDGYKNNLTHAAPVLLQLGIPAVVHISTGYIGTERTLGILEIYRRVLSWPKNTIPMPGSEIDRTVESPREQAQLAAWVRETCKTLPHEECEKYLNRLRNCASSESDAHDQEVLGFLSWDEVRSLKNKGFEIGSHTVEHPVLTRVSQEQTDQELRTSKQTIEEQLGEKCRCFAYPNGGEADISIPVTERVAQAGYDFAFTTVARFCSKDESRFALGRICIPGSLSAAAFQNRISGFHQLLKRYIPL